MGVFRGNVLVFGGVRVELKKAPIFATILPVHARARVYA